MVNILLWIKVVCVVLVSFGAVLYVTFKKVSWEHFARIPLNED